MSERSPNRDRVEIGQRWGLAAAELLRVDESESWMKTHASLSFFLSDLAKRQRKAKSTFWRLLAAGRFYNQLRQKLDPKGRALPSLEDPSLKASPESLELVNKISRVAPPDMVEEVQRQAMEGVISRRELRQLWETYRPVLGGKTARGRAKNAPRLERHNPSMRRALTEANSLAQIVQNGPGWLGIKGPAYVYRVAHISANSNLNQFYPIVPDVVVLFSERDNSPLLLHGVEAGFTVEDNVVLRRFDESRAAVDYLWFASSKKLFPQELAKIPLEIGVLQTDAKTIEVIRGAERLYGNIERKEELLRALLREASRS